MRSVTSFLSSLYFHTRGLQLLVFCPALQPRWLRMKQLFKPCSSRRKWLFSLQQIFRASEEESRPGATLQSVCRKRLMFYLRIEASLNFTSGTTEKLFKSTYNQQCHLRTEWSISLFSPFSESGKLGNLTGSCRTGNVVTQTQTVGISMWHRCSEKRGQK